MNQSIKSNQIKSNQIKSNQIKSIDESTNQSTNQLFIQTTIFNKTMDQPINHVSQSTLPLMRQSIDQSTISL